MAGTITINGKMYREDSVVAKRHLANQQNNNIVNIGGTSYVNDPSNQLLKNAQSPLQGEQVAPTPSTPSGQGVSALSNPSNTAIQPTPQAPIRNVITGGKYTPDASMINADISADLMPAVQGALERGLSPARIDEAYMSYQQGYLTRQDMEAYLADPSKGVAPSGIAPGAVQGDVDASGNPIQYDNEGNRILGSEDDPLAGLTDEERAKLLMQDDMRKLREFAEELGLDTKYLPSSIDDLIKLKKEEQDRQMQRLLEQQEWDRQQEEENLRQLTRSGEASMDAMTASMAQDREGAMGALMPMATQEFKSEVQKNIDNAQIALDRNNQRRLQVMEDLQNANAQGDAELAKALSSQLAGLEQQIIRDRANLLDQQSRASDLALKMIQIQNQSFDQFTGLVNAGVHLDVNGLMNISNQLGIPFQSAYAYYNGMEQIRSDKSLDEQKKQIEVEKLNIQLDREMRGITNADLQKIDYLEGLYRSGASAEEISRVKQLIGIPDENDPMYQARLRMTTAQSLMAELQAANYGQPPPQGTMERVQYDIALLQLQKAQMESNQITGGANVPASAYSKLFNLGGANRSKVSHTGHNKRECGEAYNDLTTGGARVGDLYSSKLAVVNKDTNKMGNIQVGNGLIIPYGTARHGHIETVIEVNGNEFTTVSWNRDGKGGQSIEKYTIDGLLKQYGAYGDRWGFSDSKLKPEWQQELDQLQGSYEPKVSRGASGSYSRDQINIMDFMDPAKLNSNDMKLLEQYGLTPADLAAHRKESLTTGHKFGHSLSRAVLPMQGGHLISQQINELIKVNLPDGIKSKIETGVNEMLVLAHEDPAWAGRLQRHVQQYYDEFVGHSASLTSNIPNLNTSLPWEASMLLGTQENTPTVSSGDLSRF